MRNIIIGSIVLTGLTAVALIFYFKSSPAQSGIFIDTEPQSIVYIDKVKAGMTPYRSKMLAGSITVQLVPISDLNNSWTTKLTLVPGVETVIKRNFGQDEAKSTGEVLSYEKTLDKKPSLTVVSVPDRAQVILDGEIKGVTPLSLETVYEGEHKIIISQPGFEDREIGAKTRSGYKLMIVATLAQGVAPVLGVADTEGTGPSPSPSTPIPSAQGQIEILDTPLGYLRVRSSASSQASEIGQVKPTEKYSILETQGGWYKIEYEVGRQGWVSSQYCKKI
jgi:hypothetical protein